MPIIGIMARKIIKDIRDEYAADQMLIRIHLIIFVAATIALIINFNGGF